MRVVPSSAGALAPWPRRSMACEDQPRRASSACQNVHTRAEFAAPCTTITGGRVSEFVRRLCARTATMRDILRPADDCQACWNRDDLRQRCQRAAREGPFAWSDERQPIAERSSDGPRRESGRAPRSSWGEGAACRRSGDAPAGGDRAATTDRAREAIYVCADSEASLNAE